MAAWISPCKPVSSSLSQRGNNFEQLHGYPTNGPQITILLWSHGRMRWRGKVKMSHFLLCRGTMCSCFSCQHPWPRYLNPTMVLHFCPTDAMIPLQMWGYRRCQACQHPRKEENSVHPCKHQSPYFIFPTERTLSAFLRAKATSSNINVVLGNRLGTGILTVLPASLLCSLEEAGKRCH